MDMLKRVRDIDAELKPLDEHILRLRPTVKIYFNRKPSARHTHSLTHSLTVVQCRPNPPSLFFAALAAILRRSRAYLEATHQRQCTVCQLTAW